MTKYRKVLAVILSCTGIFWLSGGITHAFLQKPVNRLENVITPGSIGIELTEPFWKKENAKDLRPGQTVSKNPVVSNIGENDSWVFLRVNVPVKCIAAVDPDTKRKTDRADRELFSFHADSAAWELLERKTDADTVRYVYGFREILRPGAASVPLFEKVTMINYLEGELDPEEMLTMPIEAVSIQANAEEADRGLKAVYQEYLAQEEADRKE